MILLAPPDIGKGETSAWAAQLRPFETRAHPPRPRLHVETFTIITTTPNAVSAPIHNRMPVVIAPADFDAWLTIAPGSEALLRPFPPEPMEAYPGSTAVGNVRNEAFELVEPRAGPTE